MSQILSTKISTVRRKHASVAAFTGIAAAVAAFVLVLAASMLLDFWLNLPYTARAALLALNLAAIGWILFSTVFAPIFYGPDDDEIALMVEDAEPAFRTRLIASVQLSRANAIPAGASVSLARAMIMQAESLAGPMDFARVIKTERLLRIVIATLLILIAGVTALAWGGEVSRDLLKRSLFLSDIAVPRKTRVYPITDNLLIARGDDVELLALAQGVIPDVPERQRLFIKTSGGQKQEFTLERVKLDAARLEKIKQTLAASRRDAKVVEDVGRRIESGAVFAATVQNVQEPFTYWMRLNDGESSELKVDVSPRPAITKIEAKQIYPAYTGRPIETRGLGDMALLQGSKLQLSLAVNKNLQHPAGPSDVPNFVHLIGSDKNLPLALDPGNPRLLQGTIDLPKGTTGFSINLTDEYGLKSKDPAVYRIDLVPDKAPIVRVIFPTRKEVLLVRDAKQRIAFDATDDFAIGAATIKYKIDDGEDRSIKLDLKGQHPKSFPGAYDWRLSEVQSTSTTRPTLEGSVIEYWVEVEDTRTPEYGGPNKGSSEHFMIRVVSEAEKRAEMAARIADIGSGLRSAADDQEAVANKVGTILLERQPQPSPTDQGPPK